MKYRDLREKMKKREMEVDEIEKVKHLDKADQSKEPIPAPSILNLNLQLREINDKQKGSQREEKLFHNPSNLNLNKSQIG
jgi:hypothetical protein